MKGLEGARTILATSGHCQGHANQGCEACRDVMRIKYRISERIRRERAKAKPKRGMMRG